MSSIFALGHLKLGSRSTAFDYGMPQSWILDDPRFSSMRGSWLTLWTLNVQWRASAGIVLARQDHLAGVSSDTRPICVAERFENILQVGTWLVRGDEDLKFRSREPGAD